MQIEGIMEDKFRMFLPLDENSEDMKNMADNIQKTVRFSALPCVLYFMYFVDFSFVQFNVLFLHPNQLSAIKGWVGISMKLKLNGTLQCQNCENASRVVEKGKQSKS